MVPIGVSTLINQGQIIADLPTSAGTIDPGVMQNQGSILVNDEALTIANNTNWSNTGQIIVQPGASLNLGGAALETADLGFIQNHSGGKLNLTSAVSLTTPLTLNATSGSWTLKQGSLSNGTINILPPAALAMSSDFQNRFTNVTVNGNLDFTSTTATLGSRRPDAQRHGLPHRRWTRLTFTNTQTGYGGNLQVDGLPANNIMFSVEPAAVLTLGPAVTIQGGRADIGPPMFAAPNPGGHLVNQGQILATTPGAPITLAPGVLTDQGLIAADAANLTIPDGTQVSDHSCLTSTLTGGTWRTRPAWPSPCRPE